MRANEHVTICRTFHFPKHQPLKLLKSWAKISLLTLNMWELRMAANHRKYLLPVWFTILSRTNIKI